MKKFRKYENLDNFLIEQKNKSSSIYFKALNAYQNDFVELLTIENEKFSFVVTDKFDDFKCMIDLTDDKIKFRCNCGTYLECCHHVLSSLIYINENPEENDTADTNKAYTLEEMKERVLNERKEKALKGYLKFIPGENIFGPHEVETERGKKYEITIRDFEKASGYCSCKDFKYNKLGTCKHLIFAHDKLNIKHQEATKEQKVNYPYIELYCDPLNNYQITYYHNQSEEANEIVESIFGGNNNYLSEDSYPNFLKSINKYQENKKILIRNEVNEVIDRYFENTILADIEREHQIDFSNIKADLYDYQKEGIKYSIYKKGAIIADEMGLGKTIQAIAVALSKQEIFDFKRCLIICPASLKEQWKKEIEKFTDEKAIIVEGDRFDRKKIYQKEKTYFLITNYEAVLRDVTILQNFPPDFMILDEAQRIKNYETKTAEAVKSIPKKHSLVITGTPLENNLSELYSIMQFVDPHLLTPLWEFSMNHCLFDKSKKNKITGYYNLLNLKKRLQSIVIRREKREVLNELPPIQENNVPVELSREQAEIHLGYAQAIMMILNKKFLTLADHQRLFMLLTLMRMVCDSTFLIDKQTNISPKLKLLKEILLEKLDLPNNKRKVIIFSEWKNMHNLISHQLAKFDLGHMILSGDVPVKKRGKLIEEFEKNDKCRVFLSTEAGGSGLNLQMADTVINFELPWNPAKKNQRIGRIDRLGQKAQSLLVINLISVDSIEQKIASGIVLKQNLFDAVLKEKSTNDSVDFSKKGKATFFNQLKDLMRGLDADIFKDKEINKIDINEKEDPFTDVVAEEKEVDIVKQENEFIEKKSDKSTNSSSSEHSEVLEKTLNQGLEFLSGIMQMSTGKSLNTDEKSIKVDKETGEVVMKFKLPGF